MQYTEIPVHCGELILNAGTCPDCGEEINLQINAPDFDDNTAYVLADCPSCLSDYRLVFKLIKTERA